MNLLRLPLFALLATTLLCPAAEPPAPGTQTAQSAEVPSDKSGKTTLHYWLSLPPATETKPAAGWPLMVFLHGAGERGADLAMVKNHGPAKLAGGSGLPELNRFIIVSPQCPQGRWWDLEAIKGLIDQTLATRPVDKDRVIITGLSMGGFATWGLLAKYPGLAAAAAPICGGGDPATVNAFKDVPLHVFHGGRDNVVPQRKSDEMVEALRKAGGTPEYTVFPEAGHDSWTAAYASPKLYQWMLAQKRPAKG